MSYSVIDGPVFTLFAETTVLCSIYVYNYAYSTWLQQAISQIARLFRQISTQNPGRPSTHSNVNYKYLHPTTT